MNDGIEIHSFVQHSLILPFEFAFLSIYVPVINDEYRPIA